MNKFVGLLLAAVLVGGIVGAQDPTPDAAVSSADWVTPRPGAYATDQVVNPTRASLEYRFVEPDGEPHTAFFLPFDAPLVLRATERTELAYHLELRDPDGRLQRVTYRIDAAQPPAPLLQPGPTIATAALTVTSTAAEQVFVSLNSAPFAPLSPEGLVLQGIPDRLVDYRVAAYTVDQAGNISALREVQYRIDRRDAVSGIAQPIISPVAGSFANRQRFLVAPGIRVVRATLEPGSQELEPNQVVPGDGTFQLSGRVALPDGSERDFRVEWRQQDLAVTNLPPGGIYRDALTVAPPTPGLRFSLDDSQVRSDAPLFLQPITIRPRPDSVRTVALRYRRAGSGDPDTRVVYSLDGRRAPPPFVRQYDGSIYAYALADTEVALGFDEFDPDRAATFTGPQVPAAGATIARAWARFPGGAWSAPTTVQLADDTDRTPVGFTAPLVVDGQVLTFGSENAVPFTIRYADGGLFSSGTVGPETRIRLPRGFSAELTVVLGDTESRAVQTQLADAAPPAPPTASVDGRMLSLSGDGIIRYQLDGAPLQDYRGPIELESEVGALRMYQLRAYRLVDGRRSVELQREVGVDFRPIAVPPLARPIAQLQRNAATVRLEFVNPYSDLQLYFSHDTREDVELPDLDSPSGTRSIEIATEADREYDLFVVVRARFVGRDRWSVPMRYRVPIDTLAPPAPELLSPQGEQTTVRSNAVLRFTAPDDETAIFYRLSPEDTFTRYVAAVSLSRRDVSSDQLVIEAYSEDEAGNRTQLDARPSIRFLSFAPQPPTILLNGREAVGDDLVAEQQVVAELQTADQTQVFWRVASVLVTPEDFVRYNGPRTLSSTTGATIRTDEYIIEAYAIDELGNRSDTRRLSLRIDPSAGPSVPTPTVTIGEQFGGEALWPGTNDVQIFAAVVGDAESVQEERFTQVQGRFAWQIPPTASDARLLYFGIDRDGRRSPTESVRLQVATSVGAPQVRGVSDGAIYRDSRSITFEGGSTIRYAVAFGGGSALPVHSQSSAAEGNSLTFEASPGETLQVELRARSETEPGQLSAETVVRFTIDREPPGEPAVEGVEPFAVYDRQQTARLVSQDQVFYRVLVDEGGDEAEFAEYRDQPIALNAPSGGRREYTIEAFAVDQAGNRSQTIARYPVTIDDSVVYVSADDNAGGDGSRERPFASLSEALDAIASDPRSTVFLGVGRYEFAPKMLGERDVKIVGGLDTRTWLPRGAGTSVLAIRSDADDVVRAGLTLDRVSIEGQLSVLGAQASLSLLQSRIVSEDGPAIEIDTGVLTVRESSVASVQGSYAITARDATLALTDVATGPIDVLGGRFSVVEGAVAGLSLRATGAVVRDTDIEGGLDRSVQAPVLRLDDTELDLFDSRVYTQQTRSTLVEAQNSRLFAERSVFHHLSNRSGIALRSAGSRIELSASYVSITAAEFGHAVSTRDGTFLASNSALLARAGDEAIGVAAANSQVFVVHSAMSVQDAGSGPRAVHAPLPDSRVVVLNSVFAGANLTVGPDLEVGTLSTSSLAPGRFTAERRPPALDLAQAAEAGGVVVSGWANAVRPAQQRVTATASGAYDGAVPLGIPDTAAEGIAVVNGTWGQNLGITLETQSVTQFRMPANALRNDALGRTRFGVPDAGALSDDTIR